MIYRKPKSPTIYKQRSKPWGTRAYKVKPDTVKTSGCGLVTVTHLALEMGKDVTPSDYLKFMRQYVLDGRHGTNWTGITAWMNEYGLKEVKEYEGDIVGGKMQPFYNELKKGDRVGVILFQNPLRDEGKVKEAPDGTIWCESGHYVAVCGAKKVGKRYFLYCKDSSSRNNDGWFGYRSMAGCIRYMWSGKV